MNNDELDELLRDSAQSYNLPPAPPREAMWDAIARARDAATVVPITRPTRLPRWFASAAGIAAVLLIGIAIGRGTRGAAAPTLVTTTAATTPDTAVGKELPATPLAPAPGRQVAAVERAPTTGSGRAVRRSPRDGAPVDVSGDETAYRLAVVEHLTKTEVLLTSFRAQERSGTTARLDAQFATASRELLTTTRLLLAVHRADDPMMTRLLQDLEYVLMQIAQYAADGRTVDLDAINQSLDRRNVLPKLRSTIPAGSSSAGTES